MKLDRTFQKEIAALNGDGLREARFSTWRNVQLALADLSTPRICGTFNDCIRTHGRAVVALCVAATLCERKERIDRWGLSWALAVLELWTNRGPSFVERAVIDDGIHPTRICEYAAGLINLTTEEI